MKQCEMETVVRAVECHQSGPCMLHHAWTADELFQTDSSYHTKATAIRVVRVTRSTRNQLFVTHFNGGTLTIHFKSILNFK